MTGRFSPSNEVMDLLTTHKQAIASAWVKSLASMMDMQGSSLDALVGECLGQFMECLESIKPDECAEACFDSLINLAGTDPSLPMAVLWELRKAVLPYFHRLPTGKQNRCLLYLDNLLHEVGTRLARQASLAFLEKNRQATEQAAAISEIVRIVGSTLDLGEVLTQAAGAIPRAAGANFCFFYLVNSENENDLWAFTPTSMPLPSGITVPSDRMGRIAHDFLSPSDAVWQVIRSKQPISIYDAQNAQNTTHREELRLFGIKSFLLVPCLSKGMVVAVAVILTLHEQHDFSAQEINNALSIATVIAPAIENARLYQHVEQLSAVGERTRLARVIHDDLAQTLGAMQLKTSQAGELLLQKQIEAARLNLDELSEIAQQAYTDIREVIFNLRTRTPGHAEFINHLGEYLATYQACFGIRTTITAQEEAGAGISDDKADQIMYIIQEALTNIRKHSRADLVEVKLSIAGPNLLVEIVDNGIGFDPSEWGEDHSWRHLGLQIMWERAEAIGGKLEIDSLPGQGTRVRLTVPAAVMSLHLQNMSEQ